MKELRITGVALFLLAMASLVTEISLIRVFDVLFYPNISYMIISCSLFAHGLGGLYFAIRPLSPRFTVPRALGVLSLTLAASIAAILPAINALPFDLNKLATEPGPQLTYFACVYIALALPFFLIGLIFSAVFTIYSKHIQKLYFWDLSGAALGSVIVIPFISSIGPGGLLFHAAALSLIAAALLLNGRKGETLVVCVASLVLFVAPLANAPAYFDFQEHQGKRGVKLAREQGSIEKTLWDPISKIDIIKYGRVRFIAYDGGSQSSLFYPFDGDFQKLRATFPDDLSNHFWQRGVLASHHLKEGTNPTVLVIGSAGGQEIKAALMYGARHVDAVEMVGAVVELGKNEYGDYIGRLFQHPQVSIHIGEGRSFLKSSKTRYDIVQIFSNHTSSSVAAGASAIATNYLQTSDAYREYFSHLTENGILHVNHFYYPRMITTAALAWSQMGGRAFERHVVVYENEQDQTLPTVLIKMQPWTAAELSLAEQFFSATFHGERNVYRLAVNPLFPEQNAVPLSYFSSSLPRAAVEAAESQIRPTTDDRPYFNLAEKSVNPFSDGIWQVLNGSFAKSPQGLMTLYITGTVAMFYAVVLIVVPLFASGVGRQAWTAGSSWPLYFACLGAGFIIIEFVFIQLFMHLIGSPLYTYSTVLFTMLLAASLGSIASHRWRITPEYRWFVPFLGICGALTLMLLSYTATRDMFLATPLAARIGSAVLLMFPVGFFLGMPFPLGILALENQPPGSIAWAWGMNGLFTVIGGLLGIVFSIEWGFNITLLIACGIYAVAFLTFVRLRASLRCSDVTGMLQAGAGIKAGKHVHTT